MDIAFRTVSCGECGQLIEEDPHLPLDERDSCPACQSLIRAIDVSARDDLSFADKIGLKQRRDGYKKPIVETVSGDDRHRLTGRFHKLSRLID
jgi:hypothetical protein